MDLLQTVIQTRIHPIFYSGFIWDPWGLWIRIHKCPAEFSTVMLHNTHTDVLFYQLNLIKAISHKTQWQVNLSSVLFTYWYIFYKFQLGKSNKSLCLSNSRYFLPMEGTASFCQGLPQRSSKEVDLPASVLACTLLHQLQTEFFGNFK